MRVQHLMVEEFCHKSPVMGQGNPVLLGNGSLVLSISVVTIVRSEPRDKTDWAAMGQQPFIILYGKAISWENILCLSTQ